MRLTIIVGFGDNSVGKDNVFYSHLDFSECGLPNDFWAFQWNQEGDNTGEIEFKSSSIPNEQVTEIPVWANACIAVWQTQLDKETAA